MKALVQRVKFAKVENQTNGELLGEIQAGILLFVAIEKTDTNENLKKMLDKVLNFRIFSDENNKLNLNISQVNGEILIVSQFTLAAETKGRRPGFSNAASPEFAKNKFEDFINLAKNSYPKIQTGKFAENMLVTLANDGPLTFNLSN